jgi:hypothetical protein
MHGSMFLDAVQVQERIDRACAGLEICNAQAVLRLVVEAGNPRNVRFLTRGRH